MITQAGKSRMGNVSQEADSCDVRSSGGCSLSIHTSGMRGLFLNRSDSRAQSYGGIGCLKINAGERFGDVYAFAAANNVTAIGGADPGVGVGGWLTAGGHGPLTAKYGLGADQVLEMEVVTPDGIYRTIDVDRDADLFWAMRGVSEDEICSRLFDPT